VKCPPREYSPLYRAIARRTDPRGSVGRAGRALVGRWRLHLVVSAADAEDRVVVVLFVDAQLHTATFGLEAEMVAVDRSGKIVKIIPAGSADVHRCAGSSRGAFLLHVSGQLARSGSAYGPIFSTGIG